MLALLVGGWLAFDGVHALVTGDYVTPKSGPYAGKLGPWANVVLAVGIEPRSSAMNTVHLGLGMAWLIVTGAWAFGRSWARSCALGCAVLTLWYLPFGTLVSMLIIVLLQVPEDRQVRQH